MVLEDSELKSKLAKLTKDPGVYLFKDRSGKTIYIGKAINLKNRVRSYWNQASWDDRPKLRFLVPKVKDIETIVTKSEKEALILEANLVFKHQPKYNVLLKDNKSFPWLVITYDEPYPRLIPVRNADLYKNKLKKGSKNKFYGPYTNVGAMWENLNMVHELFPLRRRRTPPFKNRPCLNYDLGKCLGPCQKLITEEEYNSMMNQVEMILGGDYADLKIILEEEMYRESEAEQFEKAAKLRDNLKALDTFNEKQNVISQDINSDQDTFVLVLDIEKDLACVQVFKTREGKLINRDTVEVEFDETDSEEEIFESIFDQYYSKIPDTELPKEILLSHKLNNTETQEAWLSERKGSKVALLLPKRGDKYEQVQLARRNAKVILEKLKLEEMEESSKDINKAISQLKEELDMRTEPRRIECFDISHIQGSDTVASMVCFIDGMASKDNYRKFKISEDQNNDVLSMKEVVRRRYKKAAGMKNPDGTDIDPDEMPDLIIIDGGKGQLNGAVEVLKELELDHIKVVGLAKREEEIFEPGESKPIILDRKSPQLFLVQRVRNEAHRFAVTYHRQLRSKRALKSGLDKVPGLGPAKKKELLDHFGTLKKVKEATSDEIASLRGFSEKLARNILKEI